MSEIILLFAAWFTSTISGIAGFGGSLIMLPVAAHYLGVKNSIPVLTISWLMGNLSRAWFGYQDIQWKPVLWFSLGAVPAAIAGSFVFVELDANLILKSIGILLVGVVLFRHSKFNVQFKVSWMFPVGIIVGFLSSVIGSAGPIGATAFLGLNLSPLAYIASEAVTAVIMHITKSVMYGSFNLLSYTDVVYGLILGFAMVLGSWTSKKIITALSRKWILYFIETLLVVVGIYMFWKY